MTTDAELPYGGTSGWSGSDTSRDRAEEDDTSGATADRQRATRRMLAHAGDDGMTWKELSLATGWHHGKSSGVLSVLHKVGDICRLKDERRDKCAVYVLPDFVNGRTTAKHGRQDPVHDELVKWLKRDSQGWCKAARDPLGFAKAMYDVTGIK